MKYCKEKLASKSQSGPHLLSLSLKISIALAYISILRLKGFWYELQTKTTSAVENLKHPQHTCFMIIVMYYKTTWHSQKA